jgi:hypothetical protein
MLAQSFVLLDALVDTPAKIHRAGTPDWTATPHHKRTIAEPRRVLPHQS